MKRRIVAILVPLLLVAGPQSRAQMPAQVDGVVSLTPVGQQSCVAVEVSLKRGESLAELRWYNNDSKVKFPRVVLAAAQAGSPPALDAGGLTLESVAGTVSGWSVLPLAAPVTSTTGTLYVMFVLPAGVERTGVGDSGGPGFGYWARPGTLPAYVSSDGLGWVAIHPNYCLAVGATLSATAAGAVVLSPSSTTQLARASGQVGVETCQTLLLPARPNPFNPTTEIRFTLAEPVDVDLAIYDLRGRRVARLLHERRDRGANAVTWRGTDDRGHRVASGIYFVRMEAAGKQFEQRLAVVR